MSNSSNSNQWWRYTAQRLLIQRRDRASVPALKKIASGSEPLGRLHALWTLDGLGALDDNTVLRALRDDYPDIRENALLLAERHLPQSRRIQARILSKAEDADARVRFQTALTLGNVYDPKVPAALWKILQRDHQHPWSRRAALASLGRDEVTLFRRALEESFDLTRELANLIGARSHSSNITAVLSILAKLRADSKWLVAALEGLHSGLAPSEPGISLDAKGRQALEQLSRRDDAVLAAAWKLGQALKLPTTDIPQQALDAAKQRALDETRSLQSRLDDLRLLALGEFSNEYLYDVAEITDDPESNQPALFPCAEFRLRTRKDTGWGIGLEPLSPFFGLDAEFPPFTQKDFKAGWIPSNGQILSESYDALKERLASRE